ncbi:uncharacterized protein LOC8082032 [Sorghum bicolor]|uniref:Uncharacterized protein n=1 Tax=Sorghum bicolor TaxID=4558 RepID=A0A1B6QQ79_SORBI|nr:uncharacterized protein LOC8082032 [Sorghum bicolor]KXG40074.1 hypothetical protein SORBI_3001G487000 [Sorghum bicolor]|eukprot:XP_002468415.2 uncharacterized protein LOC8082032 [Sorghum bicolor]
MEFMEPKDIDWSRVVSRYVRDETYEGIQAPHWADLTDPNAGRADVDDEAWFCRPDCRHPKTAEDFLKLSPSPKGKLLRSVSAMLPFAERDANATNLRDGSSNLKWRGGGAVTSSTPPKPKAAPKKRFQEDSENQDPALATPPPRQAPSRPPFGAPRWNKNAKEAIKSSAEKRPDNAEKEALLNKYAPPRQLKSTLSARNLFAGKDILGQISEFYDELKRMVGGGGRPVTDTQEEHSSNPMNPSDLMENVAPDASVSNPVSAETVKEVARQETVKKSPSPMKGKKVGLKVEAWKQRSPSVLKEVKATPPTPQRFPSPSPNRIKNVKPGGLATAASPLKKPLKEKGTPSKDLESKKDVVRQPFGVKDMNNTRACDVEGSSSSMFWFLKPCTFLVE